MRAKPERRRSDVVSFAKKSIQSSRPLKPKSAVYGGFFVLKDHGVVDLNQRGCEPSEQCCSTRRRGRRKYADEGKARTKMKRRRELREQVNPVIPTNRASVANRTAVANCTAAEPFYKGIF